MAGYKSASFDPEAVATSSDAASSALVAVSDAASKATFGATTSAAGRLEIATDAETGTGTATDRALTPSNLTYKLAAPGAIGETTPGTIRSLIKEVVKASGGSITALDCSGTIVNNYGQSADATLTLPAAATGLSFVVALGTTVAKYYRIDPDAGDQIFLDGTGAGDGKYVGIASAAAGKAISFMAIKTGESSYDWIATTISGTWAKEA